MMRYHFSKSSSTQYTSQQALMQAWMAKDSCGRTPFMLAVSVKNFEIAEIMFTVCLTSTYDFVIKATRLSKDVGGFLTPFPARWIPGYLEDSIFLCI